MSEFENRILQRVCEMQEQAITELILCTGYNVHTFDLKGKVGATRAIKWIKEEGYVITEVTSHFPLVTSYILERDGKVIASRDVLLNIKVEETEVEGEDIK